MIVFFGSSQFSLLVLEALRRYSSSLTIVTLPDRPAGRRQQLTPNPVATFGLRHQIPVFKFSRLAEENLRQIPGVSEPKALGICCVFGQIIPDSWIKTFGNRIINVHPSLLPQYRGASPATHAILKQEKKTGVTFIKMDRLVDHGPILAQKEEKIKDDDTALSLYNRLFRVAAKMLPVLLDGFPQVLRQATPQKHRRSTYTRRLVKEDGCIPNSSFQKALRQEALTNDELPQLVKEVFPDIKAHPPEIIDRLRRALHPWPGIYTQITLPPRNRALRLKIIDTEKKGKELIIKSVQLEGKNPVTWPQFLSAYRLF